MGAQEQAGTENKEPLDPTTRPQEPAPVCLLIPANSSRIRFVTHLLHNNHLGGIIHTTEADDLTYALMQDYGKQSDLLRKVFHHESISSSHKANEDPIRIPDPRLVICVAGTPAQLIKMIPHAEDGLYSRFLFFTQPTRYQWISPRPQPGQPNTAKLFTELGETVMAYHRELLKGETQVHFTDKQWDKLDAIFNIRLQEIALENRPYTAAILYRHGLITMRIAAILTTLRKCEEQLWSSYRICSDEDMECAIQITLTCLEHSLLLSSSLREIPVQVKSFTAFLENTSFFRSIARNFYLLRCSRKS